VAIEFVLRLTIFSRSERLVTAADNRKLGVTLPRRPENRIACLYKYLVYLRHGEPENICR
jgi:hypothetical protein